MRVAVGGTFSVVHRGHLALLEMAFCIADEVLVGITSDRMASGKGYSAPPLIERRAALEEAIAAIASGKPYHIREIDDEVGPAGAERLDAIVVSEESEAGARLVNDAREGNGLNALMVVIVPMVKGSDGKVISSRHIIDGKMDREGKLLSKSA
ncbi:MAG: pantetheine-phosphate adenylyltransferase [Euryarchaeota archaeon]|nr:pantetheine-phosphate adenylyltransferase [Euryarchaeota archaeon]